MGVRILGDDPSPLLASLVGIAIAPAGRHARYLPLGHRTLDATPNLPERAVLDQIGPLFADPAIDLAGHDVKWDAMVLAQHGVEVAGPRFDTMLAELPDRLDARASRHRDVGH